MKLNLFISFERDHPHGNDDENDAKMMTPRESGHLVATYCVILAGAPCAIVSFNLTHSCALIILAISLSLSLSGMSSRSLGSVLAIL